jgi:hypothetical protein
MVNAGLGYLHHDDVVLQLHRKCLERACRWSAPNVSGRDVKYRGVKRAFDAISIEIAIGQKRVFVEYS